MIVCYLLISILLLGCIVLVIYCYRLSQKLKRPDGRITELENKLDAYKEEISRLDTILGEFRNIVKEHHALIATVPSFSEEANISEQIDELEQFIKIYIEFQM